MGMSSDIMHDFVAKEIRSIYSSYDGWKTTERNLENGYDRIVLLERRNNGHRECVKILATLSREVAPSHLDELKKPEPTSDGTLTRNTYAVMIPANSNMSSIPAGILIYTMKSFAFEGKELAWVKKPVRKEEAAKVAA